MLMTQENFGINIFGSFDAINGLSESTRINTTALQKAGVKTYIQNCNFDSKNKGIVKDQTDDGFVLFNSNEINLIHFNYNVISHFFDSIPPSYLENKYNIGFWAWEFLNPPDNTLKCLSILDEIWVPSYFCVESLMKVSSKPIVRFLHPIHLEVNNLSRLDLKLPKEKFIFLTVFDALSIPERKNPLGVINAFHKAFGQKNENVLLIIKTLNLNKFKEYFKRMNNQISGSNNIIIIDEKMDRDRYIGLLKNCDAYISMHRCEGFGLTMAEAMYLGKPTIATGYSGNTDFMNVSNSYLIDFSMVKDDIGYIKKSEWWAEPDINDAAEKMKEVYNNYKAALLKGKKASEFIKKNLSPDIIGSQMKNRIEIINTKLLTNKNNQTSESLNIANENFRLQNRISSLEKSLTNRFIDGLNYVFQKLLG